jgi:hypothetical protein
VENDCRYIYDFAEKIYHSIPRGRLPELAREAVMVMAKCAYAARMSDRFAEDYKDEIKLWGLG